MSQRRARRERRAGAPSRASRWLQPAWLRLALAAGTLVALTALIAALALGSGQRASSAPEASSAHRSAAPASAGSPLQLNGLDAVTGRRVRLVAYAGTPIVLNMWASWCTGCYAEARALATFARTPTPKRR